MYQMKSITVMKLALLHLLITLARVHSSLLQEDGACHVINMFPYTIGHGRWRADSHRHLAFSWAASAQMAMDHFNTRSSEVILELPELITPTCSVYFPQPAVMDSAMEGPVAVKGLWDATVARQQATTCATESNNNNNLFARQSTTSSGLCAVLGPMDTRAAEETAAVAAALDLPHLFYYAELSRFWSEGSDGTTVGMVLSPFARAHIMLQWLQQVVERDYLAVAHFGKDGSSDLADELADIGVEYDVVVQTFLRSPGRANTEILVDNIHASGITTIFLNFDNPRSISGMASAFAAKGMLTDEFVYILSPDAIPADQRLNDVYTDFEIGSNADLLLQHSIVFDILDPFRVPASFSNDNGDTKFREEDPFYRSWKRQNEEMVQRINDAHPLSAENEAYFQADVDFFRANPPNSLSSFVYDSIMMLGIAACQLQAENETAVNRENMILQMHNLTFRGASGNMAPFPEDEAYRPASSLRVGVYNIRPELSEQGNRTYESALTAIWNGNEDGWEAVQPILFRGGSEEQPPTLQGIDNNYLTGTVRILGFIVFAVSAGLGFVSMISVFYLQFDDVVKRAQPIFLGLLCLGCLTTSFAIFTLSWDENAGASQRQLEVACTSTPWLFFVGHVTTYMALFCKLWRIDRVMQFKRKKVSVAQALGPMWAILAIALTLLVLWTTLDPWTWERTWVTRLPPETYGECTCDHFLAFFGPLVGVLLMAEMLAAYFAWKTSDIPEDFGETQTVLLAICLHFQSWLIGIPILAVIGNDSADATYLGRILLICIFSVSSVVVVVVPKIYRAILGRMGHVEVQGRPSRVSISAGRGSSVQISGFKMPDTTRSSTFSASMRGVPQQPTTSSNRISGNTHARTSSVSSIGGSSLKFSQEMDDRPLED